MSDKAEKGSDATTTEPPATSGAPAASSLAGAEAPAPPSADAAAEAPAPPKRDRTTLRTPTPTGTLDVATIPVWRMRALPGAEPPGALELVDAGAPDDALVFPDGPEGAAERALGRADTAAAIAAVEGLAGALGDDDRARTVRVRAHLMEGAIDEARALLGARRDDDALLLADAAMRLAEGDIGGAGRKVALALQARPRGLGEHYLLALVRVAEGRMQDAVDGLSLVAKSAPEHAVARYQLGQLLLAGGDPARAGTLFEMAWQVAPAFVAPAVALAEMLAESRQLGEALMLLHDVCDAAPQALNPRLLQLKVLLELGEKDAAVSLAGALHEKLPDEPEVTLLWGEALVECERADDARASVEELIGKVAGGHEQRARRLLARIALAERPPRVDDALEHLHKAAAAAPGAGELHVEIVHVAMAAGRRREAEAALEALAGDPEVDVSSLLSGALLARTHGIWHHAAALGAAARARVAGTPAEAQLDAFLATLPGA